MDVGLIKNYVDGSFENRNMKLAGTALLFIIVFKKHKIRLRG